MKVKEKVEELGGKALVKDKHIVKVDLSNSKKVEDSDLPMFESLPKLEVLNLQSTSVTDEVFKVATKIESLKDLDVSLTKITQEAADRFRRMYPKMSVSGPGA